MRGVHDSAMLGATTIEEQKEALSRVLSEQRDLLSRYVSKDVESVPQVFVPYKEVLDVYKAGLEVPEDVALMWCDDNYGYIRHFPTPEEASRKAETEYIITSLTGADRTITYGSALSIPVCSISR